MKHRYHHPYMNNPPHPGDHDDCRVCDKRIVFVGGSEHIASHWRALKARPVRPKRRAVVSDCAMCKLPGRMRPSHDPSSFCESGKRPHCTCDMCF